MKKYEELKQYVCLGEGSNGVKSNSFFQITEEEIVSTEKRLGFKLPNQLVEFWLEIGYGFFHLSKNGIVQNSYANTLLWPDQIANILLSDPDSPDCPVIPEFYDYLRPGYMPFFEIADSVSFLFMQPKSENPNAVWYGREKICDSFEEFIHRLYYESPTFYCEDPKDKPASNG
jgi:hypothetical protein